MRKLTGKIAVDENTFAPVLKLLLDGEETGLVLEIEAMEDQTAIHGNGIVNASRLLIIADLDEKYSLTEEERNHYIENFASLLSPETRNAI